MKTLALYLASVICCAADILPLAAEYHATPCGDLAGGNDPICGSDVFGPSLVIVSPLRFDPDPKVQQDINLQYTVPLAQR